MKTKLDKNKLAYEGLKAIGHNHANDEFDPECDYTREWASCKHNPDLFDDFTDEQLTYFKITCC